MPHLPVDDLSEQGSLRIEGRAEVHHLRDVLRIRRGETWTLVARDGRRARAIVDGVDRHAIDLRIEERLPDFPRKATELVVATALPKSSHLGTLVRGLTEAGVDRLVPLICRRSVTAKSGNVSLDRLERLASESQKQCGQPRSPAVDAPCPLEAFDPWNTHHTIVFSTADDGTPTQAWFDLAALLGTDRPWCLVIGPEGGFEPAERERFATCGARFATLGPMVYRLEHAAIVAAGLAASRLYDLAAPT
ncbi:MAG: 16S rRNA (uracil(1498)-N(3))-methyltransferase [Planctomycetes bacterium]|nr:16S rRNA (uracil(1498)-N(3))-methyltransferase [Planctomycetota bacterium]